MRLPGNPGFAISGAAHTALLALALISFSRTPQLGDNQESIPVAILSGEQFNQIMKGEKTAPEIRPQKRSEKLAEAEELASAPSPRDAQKEVPAPPSPSKRQPDQGKIEKEEPHPAQSAPPQTGQPQKESAKPAAKPDHVKKAAPQPKPPADQEEAEEAAKPAAEEASKATRNPEPKFRLDQVAKLLQQEKQKEMQKPAARVKSGDEAKEPQHKLDLSDIARFLSKEEPHRKQSSSRALNQLASLGSPTASAARMSPSLWSQLDGLLQEQYRRCWNFAGLGGQQKYVPEIHVEYTQEGALAGEPQLLNPPTDPNLRPLAESAMRAVRRCDPLRIPAQYQPYYDQWRRRIVRFDPEEML